MKPTQKWNVFVLECAIQDRKAYLDAWKGCNGPGDEGIREEADQHIKRMESRIKAIRRRAQQAKGE